ncbi:hypothetical protein EC991_002125 [Linnemannia zychae]|nr:hypothetical protein EC991_002125 [Linnemannia zychae]
MNGRLADFSRVVLQAPCRYDANFQLGICRQLGEIAIDPLWGVEICQQAVLFLGTLCMDGADWKPQADIKHWIQNLLHHILSMSDSSTMKRAITSLMGLQNDAMSEFPKSIPLSTRPPTPNSFPLITRARQVSDIEHNINKLRHRGLGNYLVNIYIPPLAKPTLQAPDYDLFSLAEEVMNYLASDRQEMLILGDSGVGKSTFNRYLENALWKEYHMGDSIPLFINLPECERPEEDLLTEQLRKHGFTGWQIQELQYRQFILICDGYDESQLTTNIHTTNLFNRPGRWNTKLIITCRTQYLGPTYRDQFVPISLGNDKRLAGDLFQEAVIAPFSRDQISMYTEQFVRNRYEYKNALKNWTKKNYMDALQMIPNMSDIVRNPFLLTIALNALPAIVEGRTDLLTLSITRVQLYDAFMYHWVETSRLRFQDMGLSVENSRVLHNLIEKRLSSKVADFSTRLASAIFEEQNGNPVVRYIHRTDRRTWRNEFFRPDLETSLLREAIPLTRNGTLHQFYHRSILEYFFSCAIFNPHGSQNQDGYGPKNTFTNTNAPLFADDNPLSRRSLLSEPSVIQFLCERAHQHHTFKQRLIAVVELSKTDPASSQAAANALTILCRAGVRFNGLDFSRVRIPRADLSGAALDSV